MEFEAPRVYTTSVYPSVSDDQDLSQVKDTFRRFLLEFYEGDAYIYRDQLRQNVLVRRYAIRVNVLHLLVYNENLGQRLHDEPGLMLPVFEGAAKEVADRIVFVDNPDNPIPYIQVVLDTEANPTTLRELNSRHVSRLVRIPGIIISASALTSKATKLHLVCKECLHVVNQVVVPGFSTLQLPRRCESQTVSGDGNGSKDCGPDPYVVAHDRSKFIDQQVLKLQESPEMVPVGEVPRNILVTVDRTLTNQFVPGTRCTFVGIYSVYDNNKGNSNAGAVAIRNPYLQVVGFEVTGHNNRGKQIFTEQEEQEFITLSQTPDLFEVFSRSIAPSIYGHEDVKKSLTCLLMGGSRRILPDSMRLRGDINVLLMGDPGTAKSQMLKFVEKVAPICIYTSGKGSSAAGLTASVQRDTHTRDFYLEGGAMVLADGGVVCIDEFDKMREDDRVAIHEAMEQQTISIAKAGIITVLNSRTSVLAAANPVEGRYNDNKSPGENIDFQNTILSRFDMIYVIKDTHSEDEAIASHVLNTHRNGGMIQEEVEGEIPIDKMRRYITYCRATCAPTLGKEGSEALGSSFVEFRQLVKQHEAENNERTSVPVTIRQLEALVRIAESIAKLHLSPEVTAEHVHEAIRLFTGSTMQALQTERLSVDRARKVRELEEKIRNKLRVGYGVNLDAIRNQFCGHGGYSNMELDTALLALERRGTITYRNQGKRVHKIAP